MAKLIAFDKNHNLQYEGFCKISVNKLSSLLIVEPKNEDYKMISASFQWKYSMQKNLLFVFGDFDFLDFCLVFKNEIICSKIYQFIFNEQKEQEIIDYTDTIEKRFLLPIFDKIEENPTANNELSKIVAEWINILKDDLKNRYIEMLKERNIFNQISSFLKIHERNLSQLKNDKRKRKFNEINFGKMSKTDRESRKLFTKQHTEIIYHPKFKLFWNQERRIKRSLIVYTSAENSTFHEYQKQMNNVYLCRSCKSNTAILKHDENGNICVKLTKVEHKCIPLTSLSPNYAEIKIIKKSDYEIYENYSKTTKRLLILFDSKDKSMCHHFLWNRGYSRFYCHDCYKTEKSWRKTCLAKVCNEETFNEYIELTHANHACKKQKYEPEKHQQIYKHVLKPDFEIHKFFKRNREIQTLILFDSNDRNLCYIYYFAAYSDCFICNFCRKKGKFVNAKVCQNDDGEEYVILIKPDHICELQPLPRKETILESHQIHLMENTKTGIPKLFVFENESHKTCYIFTKDKSKTQFYCMGCHYVQTQSKKKRNMIVTGNLITKSSGNHIFQLTHANQKHTCKPKKYEPTKYQNFKTTDFFYFRQKSEMENLKLAILHPNDRNLCFIFGYCKSENNFVCRKCTSKKRKISMKVEKDAENQEFFNHIFSKHLCQPIKASTIVEPKFIILKESGIEVKKRQIIEESDEGKIVRMPNFELQPSQNGLPDRRLIISHPEDPSLYYQYFYQTGPKNFRCYKCTTLNWYINAKVHIDDNGEKIVTLSKKEHVCEPLKRPFSKIIESPNFLIIEIPHGRTSKKLCTFTSETRDLCYEFRYIKDKNRYRCSGCTKLKKEVYANLITNEAGDEVIKLLNEHICEPIKFASHETKKIPESMFLLCSNTAGKKDKTLLVFSSEKKDFVFSYAWNHGKFDCIKCAYKKLKVSAKIQENENGEKFVELFGAEHACKAKKFDPKKLKEKELEREIIPASKFLLLNNRNGEKDKKLIVFTSENRDYAYLFHASHENYYQCSRCQQMKKYNVTANLRIDENGQRYLEMKSGKHICRPQKYHP